MYNQMCILYSKRAFVVKSKNKSEIFKNMDKLITIWSAVKMEWVNVYLYNVNKNPFMSPPSFIHTGNKLT